MKSVWKAPEFHRLGDEIQTSTVAVSYCRKREVHTNASDASSKERMDLADAAGQELMIANGGEPS